MAVAAPRYPSASFIAFFGMLFNALFVAGVILLTNTATYREWSGPLVGLGLVVISVPILSRQARRENDSRLFWFLFLALLVRVGATVVRHILTFDVYHAADAVVYNREGTLLAEQFRAGDVEAGLASLKSLTDTDFVTLVTGIVYVFVGPSTWGGFLFFSWLAFLGSFLMYRAFVLSVPEGNSRSYGRLLFFLPSLLYWPSSIGKESWLMFAVGIVAFGSAELLKGRVLFGLPVTLLGLWFAGLVRPHVAGFIAFGLVGAVIVRRPGPNLRQLAPVVKGLSFVAMGALAVAITFQATRFLQESGIETEGGLSSTLTQVSQRTTVGESTFSTPPLTSPTGIPVAVVTVLFRPFFFEAHNGQAMITSIESVFIAILIVVRLKWIVAAAKSLRRQPYIAFAFCYVAVSIVGLSSLANFGLLARQRTLLLPFLIVLLAIPPRVSRDAVTEAVPTGARA